MYVSDHGGDPWACRARFKGPDCSIVVAELNAKPPRHPAVDWVSGPRLKANPSAVPIPSSAYVCTLHTARGWQPLPRCCIHHQLRELYRKSKEARGLTTASLCVRSTSYA